MTKVILINGPARSGKDTLADAMVDYGYSDIRIHVYRKHKFASLMHQFWGDVFFTLHEYEEAIDRTEGTLKSDVSDKLGISYRQGMISMSEDYIKPLLGTDFFGRYTAGEIEQMAEDYNGISYVAVVSDSGFREEAVAVVEKFGAENVLLIKVYRDGFSFKGDSRNYISLEELGVETIELENTTIEQFTRDGVALIREFVEREPPAALR